jgi:hypothetical protein
LTFIDHLEELASYQEYRWGETVVAAMRRELLAGSYIQADETTVPKVPLVFSRCRHTALHHRLDDYAVHTMDLGRGVSALCGSRRRSTRDRYTDDTT